MRQSHVSHEQQSQDQSHDGPNEKPQREQPMSAAVPDLSVDDMLEVLATGSEWPLSPGVPVSQLDHALQTAALLAHLQPDDDELAVAGLVHDIGHLLPGGTDEAHAADAARAVRRTLGERVAGTVGLHVEAKRYLVATEGGYGGVLTTDSVTSLGRQGGALSDDEAAAFLAQPFAADAVTLRRADDSGKVEGLVVGDLSELDTPLAGNLPAKRGDGELSNRLCRWLLSGHHRAAGSGRTLCGG